MIIELNFKRKYLKFWVVKLKGKDKKEKKKRYEKKIVVIVGYYT